MDFQTFFRSGGPYQANYDFEGLQRDSLPIACDVAEESVLNLVPFAGSGWKVADFNNHLQLIGQTLKFGQPQPCSRTVAAAAVRRDQQSPRCGVPLAAELTPPAADRGNRKFRRVVADSDRDTGFVVFEIIHTVWYGLAQRLVREIMCLHFDRVAFSAICFPGIFQLSQGFLLLRVDRNCRLRIAAAP